MGAFNLIHDPRLDPLLKKKTATQNIIESIGKLEYGEQFR